MILKLALLALFFTSSVALPEVGVVIHKEETISGWNESFEYREPRILEVLISPDKIEITREIVSDKKGGIYGGKPVPFIDATRRLKEIYSVKDGKIALQKTIIGHVTPPKSDWVTTPESVKWEDEPKARSNEVLEEALRDTLGIKIKILGHFTSVEGISFIYENGKLFGEVSSFPDGHGSGYVFPSTKREVLCKKDFDDLKVERDRAINYARQNNIKHGKLKTR